MLFFTMLLKDNLPKLGRTDEIYIAYIHVLQFIVIKSLDNFLMLTNKIK